MSLDFRGFYSPNFAMNALEPRLLLLVWFSALLLGLARYLSWSLALYWYYYRRDDHREGTGAPLAKQRAKIQPEFPGRQQIVTEVQWSIGSCIIYAFLAVALYAAAVRGWTRLYLNPAAHGWLYFFGCVPIMIILHDAYFYLTHRLSHLSRTVFRHFHRIHHQSTNPTPFADICFHPVDALIHAGFFPLILFCLPVHPVPLAFFLTLVQIINAMGHIGYEVFPDWLTSLPLWRWVSQPTAHNLHHSHIQCNYGLYFRFWDRILKTEKGAER